MKNTKREVTEEWWKERYKSEIYTYLNYSTIFVPEDKRQLMYPKRRWENNNKIIIDIKGIGCEVVVWINVAQDWGDISPLL